MHSTSTFRFSRGVVLAVALEIVAVSGCAILVGEGKVLSEMGSTPLNGDGGASLSIGVPLDRVLSGFGRSLSSPSKVSVVVPR